MVVVEGEGAGWGLTPYRSKGLNRELCHAEVRGAKRSQTPAVQTLCVITKHNAADQRGRGPGTNPCGGKICPLLRSMETERCVVPQRGVPGVQGGSSAHYRGGTQSYTTGEQSTQRARTPVLTPRCGMAEPVQRDHLQRGPDPGLHRGTAHQDSTSSDTLGWHSVPSDSCVEECQGAKFEPYQLFSLSRH